MQMPENAQVKSHEIQLVRMEKKPQMSRTVRTWNTQSKNGEIQLYVQLLMSDRIYENIWSF